MPISQTLHDSVPRPASGAGTAASFSRLNAGKLDFSDIYAKPDPRRYAAVLGALDYRIPGEAAPVFRQMIAACRRTAGRRELAIADVGCSFGINAALLRHDVSLRSFFARYKTRPLRTLAASSLVRADREFYAETLDDEDLRFTGLDVSEAAIAYACDVGLLDDGISENLEAGPPSAATRLLLSEIDLVISTGCVGYVTERTFTRILDCQPSRRPWIASFVLRMFPYERIASALASRGYVTEKWEGRAFPQRRFGGPSERAHTLAALAARGLDPRGLEAEGYIQAEFYLSRPADEAARSPLGDLLVAV